jgi:hypothetical protein
MLSHPVWPQWGSCMQKLLVNSCSLHAHKVVVYGRKLRTELTDRSWMNRNKKPWLGTSHSLRRPRFNPGSVHVGFVVEKVTLEQVFLQVLRLSRQFHSTNAPLQRKMNKKKPHGSCLRCILKCSPCSFTCWAPVLYSSSYIRSVTEATGTEVQLTITNVHNQNSFLLKCIIGVL